MAGRERDEGPPKEEVLPAEPGASTMMELLQGGAAITKAENDTLAQMALTRPRDPARSLQRAIKELELCYTLDPESAEEQYYVIPYKNADGTTSNVTGLSIVAAMVLARHWGNCTVSARLLQETDDAFFVDGVAIDFEVNFRVSKPGSASKWIRRKNGRMEKMSSERFPQVLAIAASKAVRNAIFNMLPRVIQDNYWDRAKALAIQHEKELAAAEKARAATASGKKADKADPKKWDAAAMVPRLLEFLAKFKVERSHAEAKVGCRLEEMTEDQFGTLKGLCNALKAGQTDAYQAFGVGAAEVEKETEAVEADPFSDAQVVKE